MSIKELDEMNIRLLKIILACLALFVGFLVFGGSTSQLRAYNGSTDVVLTNQTHGEAVTTAEKLQHAYGVYKVQPAVTDDSLQGSYVCTQCKINGN